MKKPSLSRPGNGGGLPEYWVLSLSGGKDSTALTGTTFEFLMGYGGAPVKDAPPPVKKISVKEAARCMGKSDQFVRIGLQRGLLPFGNAVPGTGNNWNYYINPTKFREYVGAEAFNSFFGLTA